MLRTSAAGVLWPKLHRPPIPEFPLAHLNPALGSKDRDECAMVLWRQTIAYLCRDHAYKASGSFSSFRPPSVISTKQKP
jgi:hypothetical protein